MVIFSHSALIKNTALPRMCMWFSSSPMYTSGSNAARALRTSPPSKSQRLPLSIHLRSSYPPCSVSS